MISMTGYGKGEYNGDGVDLVVEIKTVNNRNFDLNVKAPRSFIAFEDIIRKTVANYVLRGRIDLFITFTDKRDNGDGLVVNLDKAKNYYNAANEIATSLGLPNDLSVRQIMKCPDVITDNFVSDISEFDGILIDTVKIACENLNEMRKTEGEKLVKDLLNRMDTIKDLKDKISVRAPIVAKEYKEKLSTRITEALSDIKMDEARLLNEVAFFTDKANIDEELTRLGSHITQFTEIVKQAGAGKRLDFLMQEFNRETNTICSKSNDLEVTKYALLLKNEIEKVREQVQNLE